MQYVKLALLLALIIALAGCGDDFFDGGGGGNGGGEVEVGDYPVYDGIMETLAVEGYMQEMTQNPEAPAPGPDQKGCPESWVTLLLVLLVYVYRTHFIRRTCLAT